MALIPVAVGDTGAQARAKINAGFTAIDVEVAARASAVSGEASARAAAIAAEATTRAAGDLDAISAVINHTDRPGERPDLFSNVTTGRPEDLSGLPSANVRTVSSYGRVYRTTGEAVVAARHVTRIESGRHYLVRGAVSRYVNPADPLNDAVVLVAQALDANFSAYGSPVALSTLSSLTTGSGRTVVQKVFATSSGDGVDVVIPAGVYVRLYWRTYGSVCQTDIEHLSRPLDVTEWGELPSPDLTALSSRMGALEDIEAGDRLDALEAAVDGGKVATFATRSDALGATLAASVTVVRTLGYANPGDLGGADYAEVDTEPTAHDAYLTIGERWFELVPPPVLAIEHFGGGSDVADNAAALSAAGAYCRAKGLTRVWVEGAIEATTAVPQADIADLTFIGPGSLSGVYRKRVIPANAPAPALRDLTVVAGRHLRQCARRAGPLRVVIAGDSTTTQWANTVGSSDMLSSVLRQTILQHYPDAVITIRAVGGQTWAGLFSPVSSVMADWGVGGSKLWIEYISDLDPDLVILNFGMNDSYTISHYYMHSAITTIAAWTPAPDVVLCAGPVPSYGALGYPAGATKTDQEGRDRAAGWIRTYAQYHGLGLLDHNRLHNMVRDGFDPCSTVMRRAGTVLPAFATGLSACDGEEECTDWIAAINFNASSWGAGYLIAKVGAGSADYIQIRRADSTHFHFDLVGGKTGGAGLDVYTYKSVLNVPAAVPTSSTARIVLEKSGNIIQVYLDASVHGGTTDRIFVSQIVAEGGLYTPRVEAWGTDIALISVDWSYGDPQTYMPSATDSELWSDGSGSGVGPHGGSGWNHPSGYMASLVYRPVINGQVWRGPYVGQSGTVALGSGTSTFSVVFADEEPDALYHVDLTTSGADPGGRLYVTTKATTGFTVVCSGASAEAYSAHWKLVR
jgi:lysophospholipase L1-like esterase